MINCFVGNWPNTDFPFNPFLSLQPGLPTGNEAWFLSLHSSRCGTLVPVLACENGLWQGFWRSQSNNGLAHYYQHCVSVVVFLCQGFKSDYLTFFFVCSLLKFESFPTQHVSRSFTLHLLLYHSFYLYPSLSHPLSFSLPSLSINLPLSLYLYPSL